MTAQRLFKRGIRIALATIILLGAVVILSPTPAHAQEQAQVACGPYFTVTQADCDRVTARQTCPNLDHSIRVPGDDPQNRDRNNDGVGCDNNGWPDSVPATATPMPVAATATATPIPAASTATPMPVIATPTPVPVIATATPMPVIATPTPVPVIATATPMPAAATATPIPAAATASTSVPTVAPTAMPVVVQMQTVAAPATLMTATDAGFGNGVHSRIGTQAVAVTAPAHSEAALAVTGNETNVPAGIALVLTGLGLLLLSATWRRTTSQQQ